MRKVLSSDQKQYIRERIDYRPRRELARKVGISYNALLRWVHIYGGSIDKDSFKTNIELRDKIKEMYEHHSASEIATLLNVKVSSVNGYIQRMHLYRKDGETKERLRKKSSQNISYAITEENLKKRSAVVRKTIRRDIRSIMSGGKAISGRYYRMYPQKTHNALAYICRKYNYFMADKKDRKEPIAFYNRETKRLSKEKEQHYADKYHIKFQQAGE